MRKFLSIAVFLFPVFSFAQTTIDVTESTLKVNPSSEEIFYYGFAEGDQLIFNFEEANGKELKELEIIEMPGTSRFMDYKTKKIDNKTILIQHTGIYKFRFANSNILAGRICKFKIQRIPGNETLKNFNTTVFRRTVYDTSYYNQPERFLVKSDTVVTNVVDQVAFVHSKMNSNGNRTAFNFSLPEGTIGWSYYIGVDQAGATVYKKATEELISKSSPMIAKMAGYNPLAALTLGFASYLTQIQKGENVRFYIIDNENAMLPAANKPSRCYKTGNVVNDFSQMQPITGNLIFYLLNENNITPINVTVKVTAVQVKQTWDTKNTSKMNLVGREEMYLKN